MRTRTAREAAVWRLWSLLHRSPRLYPFWLGLATRLRRLAPRRVPGWSDAREVPRPAARSLHALARWRGYRGG